MPRAGKGGRYPDEVREPAVRMVFEHQHEYPSQWKAIESIGEKLDEPRETPAHVGPPGRGRRGAPAGAEQ